MFLGQFSFPWIYKIWTTELTSVLNSKIAIDGYIFFSDIQFRIIIIKYPPMCYFDIHKHTQQGLILFAHHFYSWLSPVWRYTYIFLGCGSYKLIRLQISWFGFKNTTCILKRDCWNQSSLIIPWCIFWPRKSNYNRMFYVFDYY